MNHPGEIDALTRLVRPDVAVITTVEPAHLGFFPSVEAIADAKAEIFNGMSPRGAAILNRDNPHYARLAAAAQARGIVRILELRRASRGGGAAHRLPSLRHRERGDGLGDGRDRRLLHRHSRPALGDEQPRRAGRGQGGRRRRRRRRRGAWRARADGRARPAPQDRRYGGGAADLIDESYNASPASMRAALAVLAANAPDKGGRRIAVLGDMLELGARIARGFMPSSREPLADARVDLVFTVGPEMRALYDALPKQRRGAHAATAAEMAELLPARLCAGRRRDGQGLLRQPHARRSWRGFSPRRPSRAVKG